MNASRFAIGSSSDAAVAEALSPSKASVKRLIRANDRTGVMFILLTGETQTERRALIKLVFFSALENHFAAHIEIFHYHLRHFAVRADGKRDAVSNNRVFANRLICERFPGFVFVRAFRVPEPLASPAQKGREFFPARC